MLCEHPGARCYGLEQGGEGGGGKNWSSSGSILNREPTESADELEVGCEEEGSRITGFIQENSVCSLPDTVLDTAKDTNKKSCPHEGSF